MKNFSSRTKVSSRHSLRRAKLVRICILIVAVIFLVWFLGGVLGVVSAAIMRPIYMGRTWIVESTAVIPTYLRGRSELLEQIRDLEERVSSESGRTATIARILAEKEEFEALFAPIDDVRIAAAVVARPPLLPYDVLMIDRGSVDGILEGAVVYHNGDRALGYISRVFQKSALVTLFSSAGIQSTVYVYGSDIYTTARGIGGGILEVSIPHGITLAVGDVVVAPSLSQGIIGIIESVESNPTEPEQRGYITSDVSLQSLRTVSVSTRTLQKVTFEEASEYVRTYREEFLKVDVPVDMIVDVGTTSASTTVENFDSHEIEN